MRLGRWLLAAMALAGCTGAGAWDLAGEPGLLLEVKHYYERNGLEEGGNCTSPIMDGVTGWEVLDDDGDEMKIFLRYAYRDYVRDDDDCSRLRPLRCTVMRSCRGYAGRTFTIARTGEGAKVIGMNGERRH